MIFINGACLSIVLFSLQMLCCFKVKRNLLKLLPTIIWLLCMVFSVSLYLGFPQIPSTAIGSNEFTGALFIVVFLVSGIGIAVSWFFYKVVSNKKK